jgi:hypothetical protein
MEAVLIIGLLFTRSLLRLLVSIHIDYPISILLRLT